MGDPHHFDPGRIYYAKRIGWRWEVWWAYQDGSAEPASGATEWRALWGVKFWRRLNAERTASDFWMAFLDGAHLEINRAIDAQRINGWVVGRPSEAA